MLSEAISKIKTEMEQHKNNPYVQVVGEFLLQHLDKNPETAEKILNQEKTISKSLEEMRKAAEKKKVGNCAVLTDQEGFGIVLKYFGIDAEPEVGVLTIPSTVVAGPKPSIDFDVKLDDFLV